MTDLDDYIADDDRNKFWRLDSGDQLNLLDEAIERMQEAEARIRRAIEATQRGNVMTPLHVIDALMGEGGE